MTKNEILEKQVTALGTRLLVPLVEAAAAIGYKPQTAYNMHSRGVFPIPVKKVNGRPMVRVTDLMEFVEA